MANETWRELWQWGKETTYNSEVAASRRLYGDDGELQPTRASRPWEFSTGTRARVLQHTVGPKEVGGQITMPLSADELVEIFLLGLQGAVTPTTPAGYTNGRQWLFIPANTLDSVTIQRNDAGRLWKSTGVYVDELTFEGSANGPHTVTATLFGANHAALGALTGSIAERNPTVIEGYETRLYIDAFGGAPGVTQVSRILANWRVNLKNNLARKYHADNVNSASRITVGSLTIESMFTFEGDEAASLTQFNNWEADTPVLVRLECGTNDVIDVGTNEVQTLTESGTISGGTYTINFKGQASSALQFNATAATVQAALEAMGAFGPGNIQVTGGPVDTTPLTLTFIGALAGQNVPAVTITNNLTGSTPGITVATPTPGVGSRRGVIFDMPGPWSAVNLNGEDAGTRVYEFTQQYLYDTTNAFPFRAILTNDRVAAF